MVRLGFVRNPCNLSRWAYCSQALIVRLSGCDLEPNYSSVRLRFDPWADVFHPFWILVKDCPSSPTGRRSSGGADPGNSQAKTPALWG
jgi:hypothetical protein